MEKIKNSSGFSLVELLVVAAVIAILLGVSAIGLSSSRETTRDAKRKADLEKIRTALEMYKSDNNYYPRSNQCDGTYQWPGCGSLGTNWIEGLTLYLADMPDDSLRNDSYIGDPPANTYGYNYRCTSYLPAGSDNCVSYHLLTKLENTDDSSINGTNYSYTATNLYVVTNP